MASLGEQELQRRGVPFAPREYDYRIGGAKAAAALGISVAATVKTLVIASGADLVDVSHPG